VKIPEGLEIKETDTPCNCRWMACSVHPQSLCTNHAQAWLCKNCTDLHYLGDGTLGEDIHICVPCSLTVLDVYTEEIPRFMGALNGHVPAHLSHLHDFVRRSYMANIDEVGWWTPHEDAFAVLSLATVILTPKPKEELDELAQVISLVALRKLVTKVQEISLAYGRTEDCHVED
jgi:hypothetical protein